MLLGFICVLGCGFVLVDVDCLVGYCCVLIGLWQLVVCALFVGAVVCCVCLLGL